jgi:hypothetical protein
MRCGLVWVTARTALGAQRAANMLRWFGDFDDAIEWADQHGLAVYSVEVEFQAINVTLAEPAPKKARKRGAR